jgi:hypothetical protein
MARAIAPGELNSNQRTFLLYGPRDPFDDAFPDEAAVIAAWEKHREQLLADYAVGRRPWTWRALDHPDLRWRGFDRERSSLWRAGVLSAVERIQLEAQWREDFERGRDLTWADVPRELVKQWKAERRSKKVEPEAETVATGSDL